MATRSKSNASRGRTAAGRKRRAGRLAPGKMRRGLEAAEVAIALDDPSLAELAAVVRSAGGASRSARAHCCSRACLLGRSSRHPFSATCRRPMRNGWQRRLTKLRRFSIRSS
jgi:hypothetical protein